MKTEVKYYRDTLTLEWYFLLLFLVFFVVIIFFEFYFNPSLNLIYYILFLYIFLLYMFFKNFLEKAAVDEKGNISIPGAGIRTFFPNRYFLSYDGIRYFQFNKNNIKNIKLINYSDVRKNSFIERTYLSKSDKIVLIEFKKPLEYSPQGAVLVFGKMKPLNKIYISLNNPEKFVEDIKQL